MAGRKRAKPAKRAPLHTCVGCRTVNAKRQLVRLVRTAAGEVKIDPSGKAEGRGAYLHDRRTCWEHALTGQVLERALKIKLADADRARLQAHGEQYTDDD